MNKTDNTKALSGLTLMLTDISIRIKECHDEIRAGSAIVRRARKRLLKLTEHIMDAVINGGAGTAEQPSVILPDGSSIAPHPMRPNNYRLMDIDRKRILRAVRQNPKASYKTLSTMLGYHVSRIGDVAREHGIHRRPRGTVVKRGSKSASSD